MKNLINLIFTISIVLSSVSFAYETQKGKIDMHGGKSDKLTNQNAFSAVIGLGKVLNKKGSNDDIQKEEKKFIKIDKVEKIEKEDIK